MSKPSNELMRKCLARFRQTDGCTIYALGRAIVHYEEGEIKGVEYSEIEKVGRAKMINFVRDGLAQSWPRPTLRPSSSTVFKLTRRGQVMYEALGG